MGAENHQPPPAFPALALDSEESLCEQSKAAEPSPLKSSSRPGHVSVSGKLDPLGKGLGQQGRCRLGLSAVSAGPGKAANPVTRRELFMNTSF